MKPMLGMLLGMCLLVGCGESDRSASMRPDGPPSKKTDEKTRGQGDKAKGQSGQQLPEVRYYALPG